MQDFIFYVMQVISINIQTLQTEPDIHYPMPKLNITVGWAFPHRPSRPHQSTPTPAAAAVPRVSNNWSSLCTSATPRHRTVRGRDGDGSVALHSPTSVYYRYDHLKNISDTRYFCLEYHLLKCKKIKFHGHNSKVKPDFMRSSQNSRWRSKTMYRIKKVLQTCSYRVTRVLQCFL